MQLQSVCSPSDVISQITIVEIKSSWFTTYVCTCIHVSGLFPLLFVETSEFKWKVTNGGKLTIILPLINARIRLKLPVNTIPWCQMESLWWWRWAVELSAKNSVGNLLSYLDFALESLFFFFTSQVKLGVLFICLLHLGQLLSSCNMHQHSQ